jgi:outer membrane protein TolC
VSNSPYQAKAADENAVATKQQIILAVDQAFYNTLETNALFAVTEDTVTAFRRGEELTGNEKHLAPSDIHEFHQSG